MTNGDSLVSDEPFNPANTRRATRPTVSSISGLLGPKVDPDGPELTRARRLRCSSKDFGLPGDFKIGETGSDDRRFQLRLQQSPGNSAGPEINFSLRLLWHFAIDHDVCNLQASAGA